MVTTPATNRQPRTANCGMMVLCALLCVLAPIRAQPIPARIVSTSPSITETLFALGLGDRVVGVSTYCWYPTQVLKLPKVGTYLKPEPETIARLKPDLVFLQAGPHATASQLAAIGVKTATVDSGSLAKVFTTIKGIAAAAGVPERADKLNADLTAALDRVKASVAGKPPKKVLIVVGRQTGTLSDIVAVGPGSYLHDIAAIAGGENALAASKVQYARISMETVIGLAPDIIVDTGEMGEFPTDSTERLKVTENLWKRQTLVKAVRDGAIHASNDQAFVVPGPRIVNVARMMASWFHGVTPK
jgi:iron complex transport system substrate-binding protein